MTREEYWIGKNVDYGIWDSFESGFPYIEKFKSMEAHLIRLEFEMYPETMPLFNHEAVYKTIKGYFHDMKKACLSPEAYNEAGPLFLYSVERGSGIWSFLGELTQLILFGSTVTKGKMMGQYLENLDKKLEILEKYFGNSVDPNIFQSFVNAETPRGSSSAVKKLLAQKLEKIEISKEPFQGNMEQTQKSLINITKIMDEISD